MALGHTTNRNDVSAVGFDLNAIIHVITVLNPNQELITGGEVG